MKNDKQQDEYLDTTANEIEQGFMQQGGWKACRHLLGRVYQEGRSQGIDEEVQSVRDHVLHGGEI